MVGVGNLFIGDRERRTPSSGSREEVEEMAKVAERSACRDLRSPRTYAVVIALKSELASKLAERDPARAMEEIREGGARVS
jgi:two-component system sensor histidine kinase DesK